MTAISKASIKILPSDSAAVRHAKQVHLKFVEHINEAGVSLTEIRDKELWRHLGIGLQSFKDYCQFLGKNYNWGWYQIKMEQKMKQRQIEPPKAAIKVPKRRQIAPEAPKEAEEVKAPERIHPASNGHAELLKPNPIMDGTGIEVPPEIHEFWQRNSEIQSLLGMVSKVRVALEKAEEERDVLYRFVDFTGTISRLKMVYEELQCGKSYAVCPDCNGVMFKNCETCRGRGALPKFFWDMQPEEKRKLRET